MDLYKQNWKGWWSGFGILKGFIDSKMYYYIMPDQSFILTLWHKHLSLPLYLETVHRLIQLLVLHLQLHCMPNPNWSRFTHRIMQNMMKMFHRAIKIRKYRRLSRNSLMLSPKRQTYHLNGTALRTTDVTTLLFLYLFYSPKHTCCGSSGLISKSLGFLSFAAKHQQLTNLFILLIYLFILL